MMDSICREYQVCWGELVLFKPANEALYTLDLGREVRHMIYRNYGAYEKAVTPRFEHVPGITSLTVWDSRRRSQRSNSGNRRGTNYHNPATFCEKYTWHLITTLRATPAIYAQNPILLLACRHYNGWLVFFCERPRLAGE